MTHTKVSVTLSLKQCEGLRAHTKRLGIPQAQFVRTAILEKMQREGQPLPDDLPEWGKSPKRNKGATS